MHKTSSTYHVSRDDTRVVLFSLSDRKSCIERRVLARITRNWPHSRPRFARWRRASRRALPTPQRPRGPSRKSLTRTARRVSHDQAQRSRQKRRLALGTCLQPRGPVKVFQRRWQPVVASIKLTRVPALVKMATATGPGTRCRPSFPASLTSQKACSLRISHTHTRSSV